MYTLSVEFPEKATEARAQQIVRACVEHGLNPNRMVVSTVRLFQAMGPAATAELIAELSRTTVDSDRLNWLLTEGLACGSRGWDEVRRAEQTGILARLPRDTLGHFESGAWMFSEPTKVEQFLNAVCDRLYEELAAGRDLHRVAQVAEEALTMAVGADDLRQVPRGSSAVSRLRELGSWLAVHPDLGESFCSHGPISAGVTAALVERLRDSDPAIRKTAAARLIDRAVGYGRALPDYATRALDILDGDPYLTNVVVSVAY